MAKKKFTCSMLVEVEVEIEETLLSAALTPEWQSTFYKLPTEQDVADHIAYNFARNGIESVTQLDGFADQPKDAVKVLSEQWTTEFE